MSLLYKIINPPVKALLKSPLHGVMSSNTLLLEFTGRKSGRALSTPISYHIKDNAAHCFTSKSFGWWRNLANGQSVTLTVGGKKFHSQPEIEFQDESLMAAALTEFLEAVPRDAAPSGVTMVEGAPNQQDIEKAVPGMAYLKFPLLEAA